MPQILKNLKFAARTNFLPELSGTWRDPLSSAKKCVKTCILVEVPDV